MIRIMNRDKNKKNRRLFLIVMGMVFCFSSTSYAQSERYVLEHPSEKLNTLIDVAELYTTQWLFGKRVPKKQAGHFCREYNVYFGHEWGKLRYNDLFGELTNVGQIADLKRTKELIDAAEKKADCKTALKYFLEYDRKWYRSRRDGKEAAYKENIKKWESQIKDTGKDIWDGVIDGHYFHIPREYIWFGSNKPDGVQQAMNLLFHFPGATAQPDPNSPYGLEKSDVNVVLQRQEFKKTLPCPGFEKRDLCTLYQYQFRFSRVLDCSWGEADNTTNRKPRAYDESYGARWRKSCSYRFDPTSARYPDVEPAFDKEVGLYGFTRPESGYEEGGVWYRGSPEFPDSYMICEKFPRDTDFDEIKEVVCQSAFMINDDIYATYSFPRRMFWVQEKIQEEMRQKILGWMDSGMNKNE